MFFSNAVQQLYKHNVFISIISKPSNLEKKSKCLYT
jgi:hypothetical protein